MPSIFGNKKPNKFVKTSAKHHRKTLERNKATKNKSSLPKMDFKTKPKKKRISVKHFREQRTQQICKNIGKIPPKKKHWSATRQQKQKLAPEKGFQKPNLRRGEFLPSIVGNKNQQICKKQIDISEEHKATIRQQNTSSLPKLDFDNRA